MTEVYAVVTGASQGLGKSFATELAKRGQNLILVSLPNENLAELSTCLMMRFDIVIHYYETDLTSKENVERLAHWINNHYSIKMLINNAGTGGSRKFEEATIHYIDQIIQLNVMATSLLTHQLLPNLHRQNKAYVLNVSSLAAFSPIAYKTVYPASKAFVHSFSRSLQEELKNTNVFVSVVNPGPMKTNPEVTCRINRQGFAGTLSAIDPDKAAAYCLDQLEKRDSVIMLNRFSWLFLALLPIWLKLPMLSNAIKKELQVIS